MAQKTYKKKQMKTEKICNIKDCCHAEKRYDSDRIEYFVCGLKNDLIREKYREYVDYLLHVIDGKGYSAQREQEFESELSALKEAENLDKDYFDLIYNIIPYNIDSIVLPDHVREELAKLINTELIHGSEKEKKDSEPIFTSELGMYPKQEKEKKSPELLPCGEVGCQNPHERAYRGCDDCKIPVTKFLRKEVEKKSVPENPNICSCCGKIANC
jgi:hypothetical protein